MLLAGFRVVVTADRQAEELTGALTELGADVLAAPVLRAVPMLDAHRLAGLTRRVVADTPDDVLVLTGEGLRYWLQTAAESGLRNDLLRTLSRTRIIARGPKARAAVQEAGLGGRLRGPGSDTSEAIVEALLDEGVAGRRVVVQLPGCADSPPPALARLEAAGAHVRPVAVYRWGPSPDPAAVQRAIHAVCARAVDAVLFTSAPGAQAFIAATTPGAQRDQLLVALSTDVVPAAVGPLTAQALRQAGLHPLVPPRYRARALVAQVAEHLARQRVHEVRTPAGTLRLRGQSATLDDEPLPLSPVPMAVLRTLAAHPGEVVDRARLLAAMPGAQDLHAVEVAVARLRLGIGRPGVVETVVKRGYRLAVADAE